MGAAGVSMNSYSSDDCETALDISVCSFGCVGVAQSLNGSIRLCETQ